MREIDKVWVECVCACGTVKKVRRYNVIGGLTKSCGCLHKECVSQSRRKHGLRYSPEYGVWRAMIDRCENSRQKSYHRYGGRGISVCDRWHKFDAFYADMGLRPAPQMQIDRIDPNGNYEPGNCRWTDRVTQRHNWAKSTIKLNPELVQAIRADKKAGLKQREVAEKLGVSVNNVKDAMRRRCWKYVLAS